MSEEEIGREFRYKCFREEFLQDKSNKIAVAHNLNDQSETFLLNLFRGASLKGLSSMKLISDNGDIIRPLLYTSKQEILDFAENNNIIYRNDATNFENDYTRNKVRNIVIPLLEESFNPSIVSTIGNTTFSLQEDDHYLKLLCDEQFKKLAYCNNFCVKFKISELNKLNISILKRVILEAINYVNKNTLGINTTHINNMLTLLKTSATGKSINLPNCLQAQISYDYFIITKIKLEPVNYEFLLPFNKTIKIPFENLNIQLNSQQDFIICEKTLSYTLVFDYDIINCNLIVKNNVIGNVINFGKNNNTKKISKLFIDEKIDRNIRAQIPVIFADDTVLAVILPNSIKKTSLFSNTNNKIYLHIWKG